MVAEGQFQSRGCGKAFILICAVTVVLCGSFVFASEAAAVDDVETGPARYRVFSLKRISAEQGKKYLTDTKLGTVSRLPNTNALLVTAQPRELIKASAILRLVDAEEKFVVKAIFPASEAENLPSNEEMEAEVGDISIGTFSHPQSRSGKAKAIIDVHGDAVIAIATGEQLERIISAIGRLQRAKTGTIQLAEPNKPVGPNQINEPNQTDELKPEGIPSLRSRAGSEAELDGVHFAKDGKMGPERIADSNEPRQVGTDANERTSDELFSELLGSLAEAYLRMAEAEEMAAESRQVATEPNKPGIVSTVPAPNEPGKVSADSKEIEEPEYPASEPPQEPREVGAVEEVEAKDVAEKPKPEPELEEVAVETEQPDEIAEPDAAIRSYEPEPVPIAEEELELNLPEKLNIVDLLDLVGKYLDLDYMYDPAHVKGQVTLKVQGPIKVKELYPMLESVLKFKDFVMTRKGNLVTIVPKAKVLDIDPGLLHAEKGKVQYGDIIVTRIFGLKHIGTATAQNLLTGMKLGVSITPIVETGTLIVTGYAYRMGRIEELLEMIDRPGEPKQFRFRQLRYTMAGALAPRIKELAEQLGTVSISITAPAAPTQPKPRRGRRPATRKPAPISKAAKPAVYLSADERTNRILMIGFEEQLAVVEHLIDALDVVQEDLRTLRLYEIQNVGAEEVKEKLVELGIIGGGAAPARRITRPPAKGKAAAARPIAAVVEEPQVVIIGATNSLLVNATAEQHTRIAVIISYVDSETLEATIPYKIYSLENQAPEDLAEVLNKLIQETVRDKTGKIERVIKKEEDIVIVPDESTFSLIVYASKKNQEWIESLIKKLDKRRPQVLIDVSLVEITRDDDFEYDLNIIANAKDLVTSSTVITGGGLPKQLIGTSLEGGWNLGDTGKIQGFYAEDKIQALLTAMDKKDYGRILARPKILVNDNEEGLIRTTVKTHVSETTTSYPSQTTTGTQLQPIYTEKWTPYEAKIELTITPHISEGNLLRLEVSMVREDYEEKPPGPPDYATSNIDTIVTVPDGSTIILGGLTKLKQKKAGSKVPLLGDIPLIGGLFRTIENSDEANKLYVFVKANILRPDETVAGLAQLQQISAENRAAFEEAERMFQQREDWPGMKPKPLDPLHVLEAE